MAVDGHKFSDRDEAGRVLSGKLAGYAGKLDAIVLGLPRGGVPVAHEVAKALALPMDIWLVRKLRVPFHPEIAFGAIAARDITVLNDDVIRHFNINSEAIDEIIAEERTEIERRNIHYRSGNAAPDVAGREVIIVDDGIATGATMRAAVASLRAAGASWIVAAAPVGAIGACEELRKTADEVICAYMPEPFYAVGEWYNYFAQMTDVQIRACLQEMNH